MKAGQYNGGVLIQVGTKAERHPRIFRIVSKLVLQGQKILAYRLAVKRNKNHNLIQ